MANGLARLCFVPPYDGTETTTMTPIQSTVVFLAIVVLTATLFGSAAGGASQAPTPDRASTTVDDREVRILDREIHIADGTVTIADTTLRGPGLGEQHIDQREYTLDSTVKFDGFHLAHDGTHYTICPVHIYIQDIGIRLQNVTLTEGGEQVDECDC